MIHCYRGAALGAALLTVSAAVAQFPTFTNATAARLSAAPGVGSADPSEKDYGVGDLDQDGDLDVVVGRRQGLGGANADNPLPNTLLMNVNGVLTDQTAALAQDMLTSVRTRDTLVADLNGDGLLDVLFADGTAALPQLLLNLGFGGSGWQGLANAPAGLIPAGFTLDAWTVSAGDLTGDGDIYPDLYFGVRTGNDRILINLGAPAGAWLGFVDESTARLGGNAATSAVRSSAIVDLNQDGDMDIVQGVTNPTGAVRQLANNGSGVFTAAPQTLNSGATYNFALADLNADTRQDIIAVKNGTDQYVLNTGNGANDTITLSAATSIPNTNGFGAIARTGDLDGDGRDDVLICDLDQEFPTDCSRRLKIYFGAAAAPLLVEGYPTQQPWTPSGTSDVVLIDLDGDFDLDMLVGACAGNSVWLQDGAPCITDLNGDDVTDQNDLNILLSGFGCVTAPCSGDINQDGKTDQIDLNLLLAAFNAPCP